ncbi:MAG: hypothetical protein LAO22_12020, partial [Acidobacteriia bacterium]|nr:hypothetical protein [Terriglobia bacterium]
MKIHLHIGVLSTQLLMCVGMWQPATAQPSNTPAIEPRIALTSEQVVDKLIQRNLERALALAAYQGTRIYRLEHHGETGSRSIIERVFHKLLQSEKEALTGENQARVALNNDNYRFALTGYESMPTGPCYILSVEPLTKSKLLYRGRIWVDAEDFAVVRIEAEPAKNPSFWTKETRIEQTYAKVGEFWLPISNRSSSAIRLGGHADFTIDYQDYQITAAAQLNTPAIEPRIALTSEQVVDKLIQRNLERALALAAYQGTRIYRLEHHG